VAAVLKRGNLLALSQAIFNSAFGNILVKLADGKKLNKTNHNPHNKTNFFSLELRRLVLLGAYCFGQLTRWHID